MVKCEQIDVRGDVPIQPRQVRKRWVSGRVFELERSTGSWSVRSEAYQIWAGSKEIADGERLFGIGWTSS